MYPPSKNPFSVNSINREIRILASQWYQMYVPIIIDKENTDDCLETRYDLPVCGST